MNRIEICYRNTRRMFDTSMLSLAHELRKTVLLIQRSKGDRRTSDEEETAEV